VALSRECEHLAKHVDDPEGITINTDPRLATGEYAVKLDEANGNLDATRECQQRQRVGLAKGK